MDDGDNIKNQSSACSQQRKLRQIWVYQVRIYITQWHFITFKRSKGNNNCLHVNPGTISKTILVWGDKVHLIKDCQKIHVHILITPEGQGPTMVNTPTGTFDLCWKFRWWYKKVNKYFHISVKNWSKNRISQKQVRG